MATINEFKNRMAGGGARPNQFRVNVAFPPVPGANTALASRNVEFLCKATSIPASNIQNIGINYRGRPVNFAGERSFDPWSITVYNDTDFVIRDAFERWSNAIMNNSSTIGSVNPASYQRDMVVHQLDRSGNTLRAYKFVNAYPTSVSAIALDYDSNTQIETFEVTFQYNYWESFKDEGISINVTLPDITISATI